MTAALEGGEWSAALPGRTLPPGKTRYPPYRRRWEDNIKMDLQEVGSGDLTGSSWFMIGAGGGTCECGNEPPVS